MARRELAPLGHLMAQGVAVWLDDLSRELLASGRLRALVASRHVVGVTTNPNLFVKIPAKREGLAAITQSIS